MRRLTLTGKIQFDFQVRIGPYFADFVFPDRMLIIEVDGESHRRQRDYDAERDEFMQSLGFTVWRIENKEVSLWPIIHILNYQPESQPALTYNQAVDYALKINFRPTKQRCAEPEKRFQELPVSEPDFYSRIVKRINEMKEPLCLIPLL